MNGYQRPYIGRVRPWTWVAQDGTETPGIALKAGDRILAHLTPDEALYLSNRLVDIAEAITEQENNR